jgi:osmotically-inducible protein OsmY
MRDPYYTSNPEFDRPVRVNVQLRDNVRDAISRSTRISTPGQIQVQMDGPTVVLQGSVANERERRVVEAMVRMTPGVHSVRNELTPREAISQSSQQ